MRPIRFTLLLASLIFATKASACAGLVQYEISVQVTVAGASPGSFVGWTFGATPAMFTGTFDADDTVAGPISNFVLSVGGIDIASSHTLGSGTNNNVFDPSTMLLDWGRYNPTFNSFVGIGDTADPGVFPTASPPPNYIVGIEATRGAPLDPFYGFRQNWAGTYTITATPEPSSLVLLSLGSCLCVARRRRRILI